MCLLLLLLTVRLCSDREPNPSSTPYQHTAKVVDLTMQYHSTPHYTILCNTSSYAKRHPIFLHFVTADKFSNLIFHPKNVFVWEFNNAVIRCIKVLCNILCSIWYSVPARLVTRRMLHESCLLLHHIKHTHTSTHMKKKKSTQAHTDLFRPDLRIKLLLLETFLKSLSYCFSLISHQRSVIAYYCTLEVWLLVRTPDLEWYLTSSFVPSALRPSPSWRLHCTQIIIMMVASYLDWIYTMRQISQTNGQSDREGYIIKFKRSINFSYL